MKVLQVCAEIFPLLKTGGLADVTGALPPALAELGVDVRLLLPGFAPVVAGLADTRVVATLPPRFGMHEVRLLAGTLPAVGGTAAWVIDSPELFHRAGTPYADAQGRPFGDNHLRFGWLGWTAAALALGLDGLADDGWQPALVHAHDWHAGLAPAYLRAEARARGLRAVPSVYTIHNLAYQGGFAAWHFHELGLPGDFYGVAGVEFHGQISFMKAGLFFADRLTTVSPTYAREIQGPEQGCGLEGLLRARAPDLSGILNGVDLKIWNPATDALIEHRYEPRRMPGKARNKAALQARLGLKVQEDQPLLCIVSRLTEQKGLHLVLEVLPALLEQGLQFALLGSGDAWMEAAFGDLAARHPDQMAVRIGYDEPFAHRLIAGSDVILVPSRYEPCGLTQLYGLSYGTVPLVRRVGGLADTIQDARLETLDRDAVGFVFDDFSAAALLDAVARLRALWRRPRDWRMVQTRGMARHHGWDVAAEHYAALYRQLAD